MNRNIRMVIITLVASGIAAAVAAGLALAGTPSKSTGKDPVAPSVAAVDETGADLTADDVATIAETALEFAGTDVSAGEDADIDVVVDSGHVLVTQRSDDGAEARVEDASKRSAALMSTLSGRAAGGAQAADVTWTMADADGNAKVAVRNTPESPATAAAADPSSDTSLEAAVKGSDGWAMDDETQAGLGDGTDIPQSGGTPPTSPDGTQVLASPNGNDSDGPTDGEAAGGAEPSAADEGESGAAAAGGSASGVESTSGWDETVVDTPAWDETVVDTPAWDEAVVETPAWDEQVSTRKAVYVVSADGSVWDTPDEAGEHAFLLDSSYHDEWRTITQTVHHDATYRTVHHEAVTHTVHHDAVTHVVHHEG
jgi:hypothetical protein